MVPPSEINAVIKLAPVKCQTNRKRNITIKDFIEITFILRLFFVYYLLYLFNY